MLFNSLGFLLAFLPVTLIGYFLWARKSAELAAAWLAGASLFFYGWWDYRYIPLLLVSIVVNYLCSLRIGKSAQTARKSWLTLAVCLNLLLLGYYKYADFFLSSVGFLTGQPLALLHLVLPIGISFFTFTQIAFLVDTFQGKAREYKFTHYVLFVTYFPHLIAGPILHHKEMMPQFEERKTYVPSASNFAVGFTIFCIGLAKKVLLADNLAPFANSLFDAPDSPTLLMAWGGILAYAFQLYFDFSGYSDMAIGLSRLFGVRLPLNFDSPYKSSNISEFWRRWHMTLSRFLRDYLYIPLGGNWHGKFRRYLNLMITMLLGGLWHGAGWNFVIWGGLHGLFLVVNHAWTALTRNLTFNKHSRVWKIMAGALTFATVCVAWIFFRAADLPTAWIIFQGAFGNFGLSLPDAIGNRLGTFKPVLEQLGITYTLGGGAQFAENWSWVLFAAMVVFLFPNTQQITGNFSPALNYKPDAANSLGTFGLVWEPSRRWAIWLGILAVTSLLALNRPSEFLYFQF